MFWLFRPFCSYFYPRSPCGERPLILADTMLHTEFLSTLSLRRATNLMKADTCKHLISIHALLAESDSEINTRGSKKMISIHALLAESDGGSVAGNWPRAIFLSTLSLRRATVGSLDDILAGVNISIHALLAESDHETALCRVSETQFLSTLSLRRATMSAKRKASESIDFYPRSPCGERQQTKTLKVSTLRISIHALLAESDRL